MSSETLLNFIAVALLATVILGFWHDARDRRRKEEQHQRRARRMILLSREEMDAFRELVRKEEECYALGVFPDAPEFKHYAALVLYELADRETSPGLRDDCVFFHLTDYGRKFRDERGL